jgi:hypothetical protein
MWALVARSLAILDRSRVVYEQCRLSVEAAHEELARSKGLEWAIRVLLTRHEDTATA